MGAVCVGNRSDVGQCGAGDQAYGQGAWQVVLLSTSLVPQMDSVLLLSVVGVTVQGHLTQKGVDYHVLVVDLKTRGDQTKKQTTYLTN